MKRCWTLAIFFWLTGQTFSQPLSLGAESIRPNIVFLLADDLGWTGLRCFGSDFYETPNLDRLAAAGVRFTHSYSACTVCSPTRASIMTGIYPAKLRLTDFIAGQNRPWARLRIPRWTQQLNHRYTTLAEALGAAGYATAHVGKWHLAPRSERNAENFSPTTHGFDTQVLKPSQARGYFLPKGFNRDGESKSDYLTDYLTDQALAVIDRLKDQPFFLYFAFHTPHTPIQGRKDLVARFSRKSRNDATHNNPEYAAMVYSLDQSIGRILDRLDRQGISQQTIVLFTSDNGGLTQRYGKHDGFTENLPLRRGKGSAYEGGVRVPTIIRLPGKGRAGRVSSVPIISCDFYPTLLELTGVQGDPEHNRLVDGRSLLPILEDPTATLERNLFWHYPHYHAGGDGPYSAVRSNDWKLIQFHEDQSTALYDLSTDIGETTNLVTQNPEKARALLDVLRAWRAQVNAQMPSQNPDYDPQRALQIGSRRN